MIEEKKIVQKVNFPLAELSTLELWLLIRIPWSLVLKVQNVITDQNKKLLFLIRIPWLLVLCVCVSLDKILILTFF